MRLAARGSRNLDNGEQNVEDEVWRVALGRQARKVYIEAIAAAAVLTAVCLAIAR